MLPSPPLGQGNSGNVFIVNCCSSDLERNVAWCRLHFIVLNSHRHCSWKSYEEKVLVIILILSVDRAYPGELCLALAVIHSCSLTDTSQGNVPHSEVGTLTAVVYRHPHILCSCAVASTNHLPSSTLESTNCEDLQGRSWGSSSLLSCETSEPALWPGQRKMLPDPCHCRYN